VHNFSSAGQIEVHAAEPIVPGPIRLEVEIAIAKLIKYKSPGIDQIPAELIQARGEILLSEIHKLIKCIWNKEELLDQWKVSISLPIYKNCEFFLHFKKMSSQYPPLKLKSESR
jgi:hypothetical protein